jgi:hypothetical protein
MVRLRTFAVCAATLVVGCSGAISGDVVTRTDEAETLQRLAGSTISLIRASVDNVTALSKSCEAASDWYDRYRAEFARLTAARFAHADSAVTRPAERPRHLRLASLFADSMSRLPQVSPDDPEFLVGQLRERTTTLNSRGHYAFRNVSPGQYLIATPGLGWMGVEVGRIPVRRNLVIAGLKSACVTIGTRS